MTWQGWLQIAVFATLITALVKPLGGYFARIADGTSQVQRALAPFENGFYRLAGIDPAEEQSWVSYAFALLWFHVAGNRSGPDYAGHRLAGHRLRQFLGFGCALRKRRFRAAIEASISMSGAQRRWFPAFRVLFRTAWLVAVSAMFAPHGSAFFLLGSTAQAARVAAVHATTPQPGIKVAAPSAFDQEQQMRFGQRMERWNPFIAEAAKRFGVPPAWIRAVMQVESGGRTMLDETRPMLSSAGAMGLMQLMPATYAQMRRQYRLGPDPYDPHDNILAGAAYLRWLRGKYGYPTMFAAYNDGPGNLQERLLGDGLLPPETRSYVGNIAAALKTSGGSRRNLARFTRPNGAPVLIDSTAVASVRAPFPGEYAPGVRSVISVGSVRQGVCESVVAVKAAIRAHGGGV